MSYQVPVSDLVVSSRSPTAEVAYFPFDKSPSLIMLLNEKMDAQAKVASRFHSLGLGRGYSPTVMQRLGLKSHSCWTLTGVLHSLTQKCTRLKTCRTWNYKCEFESSPSPRLWLALQESNALLCIWPIIKQTFERLKTLFTLVRSWKMWHV